MRSLAGHVLMVALAAAIATLVSPLCIAEEAGAGALAILPIREVTVFKDGNAFVVHRGRMPTDAKGDVVLDRLPAPVLGTFWPYVAEPGTKLLAVTAAKERVPVQRPALDLRSMIEANVGAEIRIEDTNNGAFDATILPFPERPTDEASRFADAASPAAETMNFVSLRTSAGVMALPFDQIRRVTFKGDRKTRIAREELRNRLTLDLDGADSRGHDVDVGMMYLQRGLRWIPGYKLDIDGDGSATLHLQATLVNELADLEDVTANLVIGVPSFAFKDTPDPIALQESAAALGRYFDQGSQTGYALSNALMTQTARMGDSRQVDRESEAANLGPEIAGAQREEDLFVFTLRHVSLKKGARMVLPVAEHRVAYRDIYTLDIPFLPPPELRQQIASPQQAELLRLLEAPKARHVLRLRNSTDAPFTTAPALILARDRVLGQGLLTYTSPGSETDLDVTAAIEIKVRKTERETARTPNALTRNGTTFSRVDLAGSISLENFGKEPADLEVTRRILGHVDTADHAGNAQMLSALEESLGAGGEPSWWNGVSWPGWWSQANGIGRFTWKTRLQPGGKVDLGYSWHYFWP